MSQPAPRARIRRKNAAGNRTDLGWKHGADVLGNGKKVKCNYCSKIVSGGVFRFKHHLVGSRTDSEPCASVPEEVKFLMMRLVAEAKEASMKKINLINIEEEDDEQIQQLEKDPSNKKGKFAALAKGKAKVGCSAGVQTTITQMMRRDFKDEVDQQVAKFFYTSTIPFNVIKNGEFAKLCEMIGRYGIGYKPPSYHDIRGTLLKKAVDQTDVMLAEYKKEWKRTGCTIMSDGWTDTKRRSICNFLVNSPKGTVFLYSLDTFDISKTTEKIFKMLDDVVAYVGEENVVQVVTDNAANYKSAAEMLMLKRQNLYWTPCAAHCIDLILEEFDKKLKVHQDTIKEGRRITTYIYSRTMLISMLKTFTKGKDLIRPGATRFATSYLTLSCLNDNKSSLLGTFSSEEWNASRFASQPEGKEVETIALDTQFWANIIICLKVVTSLMLVLRLVDSDEKPAMGFIYDAMDCAKEQIKSNFNNVKKRYAKVWKIIDERWNKQLHRPLHAAAYYLNPQFHYEDNFKVDAEVKQGLYNCVAKLVGDAAERNKIHVQISEFHYARGTFASEAARTCRKTLRPAEWWDFHGDDCPELQRFAIRVLSLTCSSSGCERNWSSFEMVHTKRRNRLHQKKMNDLVYVVYNLKLKSRVARKSVVLPFEDIHSDDEWITEDVIEEIVEQTDGGANVELGGSSSNPTPPNPTPPNFEVPNFEVENMVGDDNVEEHVSSGKEFDDDDGDSEDTESDDGEEEDIESDGGGDDDGQDFVGALDV